jgi:TonB-dependent starch-binding outer membrane protein SusC
MSVVSMRLPLAFVVLLLAPQLLGAQDRGSLVGTLYDFQTYRPVSGGTVSIVGTEIQTRAGRDGNFSLSDVPAGTLTIRIQAQGYVNSVEQVEVTPQEVSFVQFELLPFGATLSEVLVMTRRGDSDLSGAAPVDVTSRPGEESLSAADLLSRRVPGLSLSRGGGNIGSGSRVVIRGVSTIVGTSTPSIYLDGVRISDSGPGAGGVRSRRGLEILDEIPAAQVKRIRVLRGAAAAAMYGDSADGVILIETKRGDDP